MLKEIHFQNWKSFKQATLYIDQLTLLIGTNASGKSNIVESLEFLRRIAIGKNIQTALSGDSTLSSLRGGLEWVALKSENQFTLSVLVDSYKKQTDYLYSITIKIDSIAQIISESLRCIKYDDSSDQHEHRILFETHPQSRDKQHDITELFKLVYALPSSSYHSLSEFSSRQEIMDGANAVMISLENIFILEPMPANMRTYTPLSFKLDRHAKNIAGVLAALPEVQKTEVENILSSYTKQLPERDIRKVWAETVGRLNSDAMLYCEEEWWMEKRRL